MMEQADVSHDSLYAPACLHINTMCSRTVGPLGIVISSAWIHTHDLDQISGLLESNGIEYYVIGAIEREFVNRGEAIKESYFKLRERYNINSYVVIDGNIHEVKDAIPMQRLICPDITKGFSSEDCEQGITILNNKMHNNKN